MASEKRRVLNKELLFLILQFCNHEGYKKTAHMLEQESGCYFDMVFFEDLVLNGKWEMVEKYLSGFTSVSDNKYSTKIYFEIRKLNFLEALNNNDHAKALDILSKDLKELLSTYEDAESSRKILMNELKKLIELNPIFHGKLKFPVIKRQSLNWQHIQCQYPQPNPDIETLFEDHVCQWPQNHLFMQSADNLLVASSILHPGQNHNPESSVSDELPIISMNNGILQNIEPISNTGLPKTVARILNDLSSPMSKDFHPVEQTFLLVGTNVGDIGLWDVNSGVKKLSRNFMVWNIGACSTMFKGLLIQNILCNYIPTMIGSDVQQKLEIDAHVGGVNDLAFSTPSKQHVVITGGDDKLIKAMKLLFTLLPHCKDDIHFIYSTSVDGKIKAWLYDNMGPRVRIDAPGLACTTMAYSADNRRFDLFSINNGIHDMKCDAKRTCKGLRKNSSAVVQFSPIKKFLAAADDHVIKIWDMDKVEHLTTIDAGDLPASPHIRFNKDGTLLAVTVSKNKIKILATAYGLQFLNSSVTCFVDSSSDISDAPRKNCDEERMKDAKSKIIDKSNNKSNVSKIVQISMPSQCKSLLLSGYGEADKIKCAPQSQCHSCTSTETNPVCSGTGTDGWRNHRF
ncbi:hypothetical protein V6N12_067365 [Hibiscus sabdariffa]|uniref:CTLH domain-containing protein n=1 Tax=Hibiscus sabdariffa TaxID=183260 RepID=A0ABR2BE57_9ROSI